MRFRYHARSRDGQPNAVSLREADPYALVHIGGAWILVAYCHLRHDRRHFRLDRMEEVALLDKRFTRPTEFKIRPISQEDRNVVVRALFDHETARWVQEAPSFFQVAQEAHPDGLLVTLTIRQPGDILNWLLSWGSHVRVLEPESLREALAVEARGILDNHAIRELST